MSASAIGRAMMEITMTRVFSCWTRLLMWTMGAILATGILCADLPLSAQSLPTPAMTGPLATASPNTFDAGPFGKLDVTGIVSGIGMAQGNHVPGDDTTQGDLSNGQAFVQKTTGWWQFYGQAGAYNLPAIATPYVLTADAVKNFYGPLPVGYLKLAPAKRSASCRP
jgi:hypothetical protein